MASAKRPIAPPQVSGPWFDLSSGSGGGELVVVVDRPAVQEHVPTPTNYLRIAAAAAYIGFTASGLRDCIRRGEIVPDGRGARNVALFKPSTLDRFVRDRAARYPRGRSHAAIGEGESDAAEFQEADPAAGRPRDRAGRVPDPSHLDRRDGKAARSGAPRRRVIGRGGVRDEDRAQGRGDSTSSSGSDRPRLRDLVAARKEP